MTGPSRYYDSYFDRPAPGHVVFFPGATWACVFWKTGYSVSPGEHARLLSMLKTHDAARALLILALVAYILLSAPLPTVVVLIICAAVGMEVVFFVITRRVVSRYPKSAETRGGGAYLRRLRQDQETLPAWRNRLLAAAAIGLTVLGIVGAVGFVMKDPSRAAGGALGYVGILFFGALAVTMIAVLRGQGLRRRNADLERLIAERTAELERVSRHKSEFLANMSHELRTPLNAIIGFSDVMLGGMAGTMPDKQKEFVGDIRDSGRHLLALINDILDLSKIEAGRMELLVGSFDVPATIGDAMTLVRVRAERHSITFAADIAPEVGVHIGDERKFKQIVLNLLTNAVKFTPPGGRVTIAARREADRYVFSVADTGVGIAPEDLGRIFEEFRQVGTDHERRAEGTGLGLALTRRLVELHGGSIRVESVPGHGSTFTFELPIAGSPAASPRIND